MTRHLSLAIFALFLAAILRPAEADTGKLTVRVDQPGVKISPMLYGLMTEEINHSYDGGLYGELIQNRSFKDSRTDPVHWYLPGSDANIAVIELDTANPVNTAQSTSLKLTITSPPGATAAVANDGFWGIPVRPGTRYHASFFARASGIKGPLTVAIESLDGTKSYASAQVSGVGAGWKRYTCTLTTPRSGITASTANRFVISAPGPGTLWLSQVSLFPPTFNNRPNGNRIDLMKKLGDMNPAFLRLPGGNYLEGNTFPDRFAWKDTIHDISERPGHRCPWGYRSSDGMGLLEYFEWCEDLKMQPILAVFAGYVLRGQHVDAGPQLQQYVDEAIEEIGYATGDTTTKWGAIRAADGHPKPFKIEYVEIGNEDTFDRSGSYDGRFTQFFDAIRAKYPALKIIATAPVRTRVPDLIDDHYYRSAAEMERDSGHYDRYSRTGPKIFVGEWASTEGSPTPTLQAALGDAAWMTGMERNSDLIPISCYAPLLVNVNRGARQWGTNLIGYDALSSFGSPSYYVQSMFAKNRGDVVLPVQITPQLVATAPAAAVPAGAVGVGTWSTNAEYRDMKVTHDGDVRLLQTGADSSAWHYVTGNWQAASGVLTQSGLATNCRAVAGDAKWTNYTYTLKARKVSGAEGFLILFHVQDDNNYLWWNVGGWGNTRTAIERVRDGAKQTIGRASDVTVEPGRWYDVRIEVEGRRIRCYLDDKLVTEANDLPGSGVDPLYATASRDAARGDVIVKVVNVSAAPQELQVDLQGAAHMGDAFFEVISGDPSDVNSIAEPEKVAPKRTALHLTGPTFTHTFPAHSVSVLRVNVK